MGFEIKDIVESLGWDKAPETRAEFEEKLKKEFIPRSSIKDDPDVYKFIGEQTGKRLGQLDTILRQQAKEVGVDKIEGEKYEEIIPHIFSTIKTNLETLKTADKKTKDQKFLEVESERDKYKSQFESEKERADKTNLLLEEKDKEITTSKKNWTIEQQLGEITKSAPFTDDYKKDVIRQKGFQQFVKEETKWDLNENGELIVLDKEGKPFANPAGNKFKTPSEVYHDLMDKAGVKANNNLNNQRHSVAQQLENQNGQSANVPGHGYKRKS